VRAICPKCKKPAHRLFGQVSSPKTHRSTNVNVPAVFCGEFGTTTVGGRVVGVFKTPKGTHGVVALNAESFLRARLSDARLTTRAHPEWKGAAAKPTPKPAAKPARKVPRAAAKPSVAPKHPKARPKAKKAPKAATEPSAPIAEPAPVAPLVKDELSPAGKALLERSAEALK